MWWKFKKKANSTPEITSKTIITTQASEEVQSRYIQLDNAGVERLFIKFLQKGGNEMPPEEIKYEIVSDVDNKIKANEIHSIEVDRIEITNYRARIEAIKANVEKELAEVAELEKLIEKGELIIKIADEEKAKAEAEVEPNTEETPAE